MFDDEGEILLAIDHEQRRIVGGDMALNGERIQDLFVQPNGREGVPEEGITLQRPGKIESRRIISADRPDAGAGLGRRVC